MSILTKAGNFIYKHKSTIFIVAGIGLGAGCIATTAIQTVKACDIIANANSELDDLDIVEEDDEMIKIKKEVRRRTTMSLIKTYAVPATLGVGSVACTLAAFKILSNEKAAAVAALSATTAAFEKYRSRVIEKYGAEADYELYNGKKEVTVTEKDGTTVTKVVNDPIDDNCYTKIFSFETSTEWKSTWRLNKAFIDYYERYWNEQLHKKGYVTYNEVIESLGFSRKVGDYMTETFIPNGIGWVSAENVPEELEGQFDTFISFAPDDYGITFETEGKIFEDPGYVLRFNCYPIDGLLMRKAEEKGRANH